VWAPARKTLSVVIDDRDIPLEREKSGHFSGLVTDAAAGTLYRFRPGSGDSAFPDPASRFQPEGPHGPSMVVDPSQFKWTDAKWKGIERKGQVIYEMHIGTFSKEGTWLSAIPHFERLANLCITTLEVMPIHAFPGEFGWGYDGVDLWAPTQLYGTPDDARTFIDAAHRAGLAVILDVVYNHFGPDGCYLREFTPAYFTSDYINDWGDAVNFDGKGSEGVRELCIENAAYWIDEFHFDGLRLDATQSIFDRGTPNVMTEICRAAREAAGKKTIYIVGENEPQDVKLLDEFGLDALWNDDWHHAAHVAMTGHTEAYYTDYRGTPQEFLSMAKLGFLYQGQWYSWQKQNRGTASHHLEPERFVICTQNHDQVANSVDGRRLHQLTSPGRLRAVTALQLLLPQTPMLFQGQEFAASAPFLYFADHKPELAHLVKEGRRIFLTQFPSMASAEVGARLDDPHDRATFERCKLDHDEFESHASAVALHRDLLALRRDDSVISEQSREDLHGAVLAPSAFLLRWFRDGDDRLLLINFGVDVDCTPALDPLLAAPAGMSWEIVWASEDVTYGGRGIAPVIRDGAWHVGSESAVLLKSVKKGAVKESAEGPAP
jgi:maltooligosyltrehalose trehalohydrolase